MGGSVDGCTCVVHGINQLEGVEYNNNVLSVALLIVRSGSGRLPPTCIVHGLEDVLVQTARLGAVQEQ